jgi:hypothetical protein
MMTTGGIGFMQWIRRCAFYTAWVLVVFALHGSPCSAQVSSPLDNSQISKRPHRLDESQMEPTAIPGFNEKRLRMLNAAQHDAMVADTERLVKLVTDLNAQISNSHASALTAEQLRMVAEIEKLAHSVRDKMRMTVRTADFDSTTVPPFARK